LENKGLKPLLKDGFTKDWYNTEVGFAKADMRLIDDAPFLLA
jgi:hypothetical protein